MAAETQEDTRGSSPASKCSSVTPPRLTPSGANESPVLGTLGRMLDRELRRSSRLSPTAHSISPSGGRQRDRGGLCTSPAPLKVSPNASRGTGCSSGAPWTPPNPRHDQLLAFLDGAVREAREVMSKGRPEAGKEHGSGNPVPQLSAVTAQSPLRMERPVGAC